MDDLNFDLGDLPPPPPPNMLNNINNNSEEFNNENESWEVKYTETRKAYKEARAKNRAQGKRARQLLTAVACKLEEKERELEQLRHVHDTELTKICQNLLNLQACMTREQDRVERILVEKDKIIQKQQEEIEKLLLKQANESDETSIRSHGSFRQFKRDKKQKSQDNINMKNSVVRSRSHDEAFGSMGSSEDSLSSSPSQSPGSVPKHPTSNNNTQRQPLRLTLSTGSVQPKSLDLGAVSPSSGSVSSGFNSLILPRKGILKSASSYGSLDSNASGSILQNLQRLIDDSKPEKAKMMMNNHEGNRSDSGRESEEPHSSSPSPSSSPMSTLKSVPPPPSVKMRRSVRPTDSANSSFDDNMMKPKPKPKPPPRSSSTKLTSPAVMSKGTTITKMVEPPKPERKLKPSIPMKERSASPHRTIVNISSVPVSSTEEKEKLVKLVSTEKKRVKFNPALNTSNVIDNEGNDNKKPSDMERNAIKLLEESIKGYKPVFESKTRFGDKDEPVKTKDVSYFEPYL